jgi:hypothetical protein
MAIDPRLRSALDVQLRAWRASLDSGADRVGWKLGTGERERIGPGPVIGHLTTASLLEPGATYVAVDPVALHADVEVAVELGADVPPDAGRELARAAIARWGVALEVVELDPALEDPETIVATNVFHRAVAFGGTWQDATPARGTARALVDGKLRATASATGDHPELIRSVASILGAMGLRLQRGDRLITGSVIQIRVNPGEVVVAELDDAAAVDLRIA